MLRAYPSTSPLFFPLDANSLLSSTPIKRPGFPLTEPTNLTVPYISPGTLTSSPTINSACILLTGVEGFLPVKALYEAFLAVLAVLALSKRFGELFVDCRASPLCRGVLRDMMYDR